MVLIRDGPSPLQRLFVIKGTESLQLCHYIWVWPASSEVGAGGGGAWVGGGARKIRADMKSFG